MGVGVAKKATLQSYGIETAADISAQRVLAVPGFGPVLANTLVRWRAQQERMFKFDPRKGVDMAAKNAVERQIFTERLDLEWKLNEGLSKLIVSTITSTPDDRNFYVKLSKLRTNVQAETDLRVALAVSAVVACRMQVQAREYPD